MIIKDILKALQDIVKELRDLNRTLHERTNIILLPEKKIGSYYGEFGGDNCIDPGFLKGIEPGIMKPAPTDSTEHIDIKCVFNDNKVVYEK